MGIIQSLSVIALRQVVGGVTQVVGVGGIDAVLHFLSERFTDNSRRLTQALQGSTSRAWNAVEIALAGESLWQKLDDADDRAFRQQLRAYLDTAPLDDPAVRDADSRARCLQELRAARKSGLLLGGTVDTGQLARQAADLAPFAGSAGLIEREWNALDDVSALLREAGHEHLARLVALRPGDGRLPLIAVAVRYFFRRAVEQDAELHRGLSFAQWEALAEGQRQGFEQLADALDSQGRRLDELLDVLGEVRVAVLDLRREIAGQREQIRQLAGDVLQVLTQHQLERRELRGGDSLSIRTDDERRLVRELVHRYRALPPEQRRELPALLNAVGKMEVVTGNFESARHDFEELVKITPDERGKAEAFFNAFQAALECRHNDEALLAYQQAVTLDPDRFALFPSSKYEAERLLGAGGFGIAFLCRDRHTGARVVIKALRADGLDRSVSEVFAEARVLEELHDEGIIRLRHCDYAGAGSSRPYLVMDYFEGVTLADHVTRHGPLPVDQAVPLLGRVARALHQAHARGICHRDVKPGNILVAAGGHPPLNVKLIDFGLALRQQVVQTTLGAAASYTQTVVGSSIAGTLDYAAPEQLGKRPGDKVGPPADVYGLGKTACFALFGTTQPLARHWRGVSPDLADLLGQCLAEDPKERPASCLEVAERLTGTPPAPTPAPAPPPQPRLALPLPAEKPTPKLDPLPTLIAGGVMGGLVGLLAGGQKFWAKEVAGTAPILALLSTFIIALGAIAGRRSHEEQRGTPHVPGLKWLSFILAALVGQLIPLLLLQSAYSPSMAEFTLDTILVGGLLLGLGWGLGFAWGRVFGRVLPAVLALGLTALLALLAHTPAFFFVGLLFGGVAALAFEVIVELREADTAFDGFLVGLLAPPARKLFGRSSKPQEASPERPPDQPAAPSVVSLAFRLPLLLVAGGAAGMLVGVIAGAANFDLASRDFETLMLITVLAGVAGGVAILFVRMPSLTGFFPWLVVGGAIGPGLAALAGGLAWYWVKVPSVTLIALTVWAGAVGAVVGARLDRPLTGLVLALLLFALCFGSGVLLGHPDPAAVAGVPVGVVGGTLLWAGLPRTWRWLSVGLAVIVAAPSVAAIHLLWPNTMPHRLAFGDVLPQKKDIWFESKDGPGLQITQEVTAAVAPDGGLLLTPQREGVFLWDVSTGNLRDQYQHRSTSIVALGFPVPGGPVGLAAERDQGKLVARPVRIDTGDRFGQPVPTEGSYTLVGAIRASSSPDPYAVASGAVIAIVSQQDKKSLHFWSKDNATPITVDLKLADSNVTAAAIMGRSQKSAVGDILLGHADGTIRRLTSEGIAEGMSTKQEAKKLSGKIVRLSVSGSLQNAFALTRSSDEKSMYGPGGSGGTLLVWNVAEWKDFFTVTPASGSATCAAFSENDQFLLVGTDRGTVELWDVPGRQRLQTYSPFYSRFLSSSRSVRDVLFIPGANRALAVPRTEGRIQSWEVVVR